MMYAEIKDMLSELIEDIDYDIWKSYFIKDYDMGDQEEELERLVGICWKHIKKEKQ